MRNKKAIELNYFELGQIMGAMWGAPLERLQKPLQLKLRLAMATAYKNHRVIGPEARKDITKYKRQLKVLEQESL